MPEEESEAPQGMGTNNVDGGGPEPSVSSSGESDSEYSNDEESDEEVDIDDSRPKRSGDEAVEHNASLVVRDKSGEEEIRQPMSIRQNGPCPSAR